MALFSPLVWADQNTRAGVGRSPPGYVRWHSEQARLGPFLGAPEVSLKEVQAGQRYTMEI